jgi:putative transposase
MVRGTVETLNALLDAEADWLCGAGHYVRIQGRRDTRAGSYDDGWVDTRSASLTAIDTTDYLSKLTTILLEH